MDESFHETDASKEKVYDLSEAGIEKQQSGQCESRDDRRSLKQLWAYIVRVRTERKSGALRL